MNFRLTGYIQLSKPIEADLKPLVVKANDDVLRKGVPKGQEGSRITSCSVSKDRILLTIEGTRYLRPHDALVRFKKLVAEELGKKLKVGVRGVFADEYSVTFETAQEPKTDVVVPFADNVTIKGKACTIVFKNIDEETLGKNYIDKIIKLVDEKIRNQYYEGRDEFKELVWNSKEKKIAWDKDPAVELEKAGWIRRTRGKGQFVEGREFTALMNTMRELFVKHVFETNGFVEMTFPKFEPWSVPQTSGHASSIYPNMYMVCTPKTANPKDWEPVMDHYKITGEIDTKAIMDKVASVGIMSYAQCPPFWPYLEGRTIDESSLPLKVYDWSGPTYRNEAGGTHGLDRVEEFHRIETLWVATKDDSIKMWKQAIEMFKRFYDEVLDLEIRLYRVAPWWMAHEGKESEKSTEETGTYDFDIYLPYRGKRDAEWLEVQNASSIGAKYPTAFSVKGKKEELWSGCCGASLERVIVSFLAQKGMDTKNWPKEVADSFNKKMKAIKPLKFA